MKLSNLLLAFAFLAGVFGLSAGCVVDDRGPDTVIREPVPSPPDTIIIDPDDGG